MKRNLFLSLLLMGLTFLGTSTVGAMDPADQLADDLQQRLSVSGSRPVLRFLDVQQPDIRIDEHGLLRIEGSFTFQKGEGSPITVGLRTGEDRDFYLGDETDKQADEAAIAALGDLSADKLGPYRLKKLGPVTIQRANPNLMEFYEVSEKTRDGTRYPIDTIGSHWPNIWKKRLQNHSPSTLYVLEERGEGDTVRFIGHIGLGHQSDTQWVYFSVFEEDYQCKGIGDASFNYILREFIPALYGNSIVGPKVASYNSLLLKTDNESPIASIIGPKVEQFRAEGYNVAHRESADRPAGRKGHEVVIDLTPVKERVLQAQQAATVAAAEGSAEPFTLPAEERPAAQ